MFEGDKFLTEEIRRDAAKEERGYSIWNPERDKQGALCCTQDVTLKRQ